MEEGRQSTGYWCHECSRAVETITNSESIKCSLCHGGFVEEMDSARSDNHIHHHAGDSESDRALSLWAPRNNPRHPRRFRQIESDENDENHELELDRELESIMRRRRRGSATILQLLQGIRAGMITESDNNNNNNSNADRERDRERVIVINPFNQTIILQGGGSGNPLDSGGRLPNHPIGSLGDYFVGPGLELLLQHLAENDPNRYGTPPAEKEVVEAMPMVKIEEDTVQCSICLEDFEVGNEAKEMPCKHRFHGDCIKPWLDLHSSCPVCRYQLPSDESKLERERESSRAIMVNGITGEPRNRNGEDGDTEGRNGRWFPVTLPWPNSHLITNPSAGPPGSGPGSGSGSSVNEGGEDDH